MQHMPNWNEAQRASLQYFEAIGADPARPITIAEAALMVALPEYPSLAMAQYLTQLDRWGEELAGEVADVRTPVAIVERITELLAGRYRLRGNIEEYYDPKNSFLNEVLERRVGLPISLAIVYCAVAERAGVLLDGIGVPGHFLLRYQSQYLDPFYGTHFDRAEALRRISTRERSKAEHFLDAPVDVRQMLLRLLSNLKYLYVAQDDFLRALLCAERSLHLVPDSAADLRDRGLLLIQLEQFARGMQDLERFLDRYPHNPHAEGVRARLEETRRMVAHFH